MTESTTTSPTQPLSLVARIIGVITSPKATFENVVANPKPAGVLLVVALVIGLGTAVPQFSEAGRQAFLAAQVQSAGSRATPESTAMMETFSHYLPYMTIGSSLIFLPIMSLIFAGLYWAAFNTILGGTATFKQVLAIVTHSQVIGAVGILAALPVMLMRPTATVGGPFNLGAVMPMLEQGSRLATFLSMISVFSFWGLFVTSIGLGVLYRRKTTGIFIGLLVVYLIVMFGWTMLATLNK